MNVMPSSAGQQQKVLILGGTGRVGASTASALLRRRPDVEVILASRSRKTYDAAIKKRPELANAPVLTQINLLRLSHCRVKAQGKQSNAVPASRCKEDLAPLECTLNMHCP